MAVNRKHLPPIWTRPAPGTRRPRFTREQIAEAALAIADREGFDAVSMRRVADVLGAATMTLYHYVRTKEDLIALMDDTLMAAIIVPDEVFERGWRGALTEIAQRTRAVLARHPWSLHELRGARTGPNGMLHVEQSMHAVDGAPLGRIEKIRLLGIVDDFVIGHALRESEFFDPPSDEPGEHAVRDFLEDQLRSGAYPYLAKAIDLDGARDEQIWQHMAGDETFAMGLAAIFDSVERAAPRRPRGRQQRARAAGARR